MVGAASRRLSWLVRVHCLHDMGCAARTALQIRTLSFTVLLAGAARSVVLRVVWCDAQVDAGVDHCGGNHFVGACRFSRYVLLLPRRLLQSILGRPARVCRRRATEKIPWRTLLSSHPAEHPPLLSVCRSSVSFFAGTRCLECFLVRWALRHRHRHAGFVNEPCAAHLLYAGLPLLSSPRGRFSRPVIRSAGSQARL